MELFYVFKPSHILDVFLFCFKYFNKYRDKRGIFFEREQERLDEKGNLQLQITKSIFKERGIIKLKDMDNAF